jgi:hypothetical protein
VKVQRSGRSLRAGFHSQERTSADENKEKVAKKTEKGETAGRRTQIGKKKKCVDDDPKTCNRTSRLILFTLV